MLNKISPKTDHCGTPFKRADQELKDLLITSKRLLRIQKHIVL